MQQQTNFYFINLQKRASNLFNIHVHLCFTKHMQYLRCKFLSVFWYKSSVMRHKASHTKYLPEPAYAPLEAIHCLQQAVVLCNLSKSTKGPHYQHMVHRPKYKADLKDLCFFLI